MPTEALFTGRMAELLIAFESSYGVPPAGNWRRAWFYADEVEPSQPPEVDPAIGVPGFSPRDPQDSAPGLYSMAGSLRVPLCLNGIGDWLKLAFGAPESTGDEGDFVHVFASGAATLPTMSREVKKAADFFDQNAGEAVQSIRFALAREAGYRGIEMTILGREQVKLSATGGGTPTAAHAYLPMPAVQGVARWNGVAVGKALSADLTYNTGMVEARYPDGSPKPHLISAITPDNETSLAGSIRVRGRNETLAADARSKTPRTLDIEYQISATRTLILTMPRVTLGLSGQAISGPGGTEQSFTVIGAQTADAPMMTVTLKNAVESYAA